MCVCVCAGWCAALRIDLNGIIDLLYTLITLGISRPDGGFSLLTGLRNPLLREQSISSQLISDKPMEFLYGLLSHFMDTFHCSVIEKAKRLARQDAVFTLFVGNLTCLFMYVYRCMCDCLYVSVTPALTLSSVTAWVLNYSCVCVPCIDVCS